MRRKDRETTAGETRDLLERGTWGVLSTVSDGTPYGVPLNYYYSREENAVFFHCAGEGRKLDNIGAESRVSFAVVVEASVLAERFTTLYSSVIVSGRACLVSGADEKIKRLRGLCAALAPGNTGAAESMISRCLASTEVLRLDIEAISGKRNSGLS
jgi:uncharacterized protein